MTLVARRPLTVAGRDLAPGDPLPDGLRPRTVDVLLRSGRVLERSDAVDIDRLVAGAEHEGFGRWRLPNGMRVRSKKAELRETIQHTLREH